MLVGNDTSLSQSVCEVSRSNYDSWQAQRSQSDTVIFSLFAMSVLAKKEMILICDSEHGKSSGWTLDWIIPV